MPAPITTYCTVAQLEAIGMRAEALVKFDTPAKEAALEVAARQVDSYLGGYTLPLVAIGADLTRATAIIAAYDLLSTKGFNPDANASDKNVRDRFLDVKAWLEQVAKEIVIPSGLVGSDAGAVPGETSGAPRVISSESRGYSVRGTSAAFNRGPFQGG